MSGQNCATCQHATEKTTFPACAECFRAETKDRLFPGWVKKVIEK